MNEHSPDRERRLERVYERLGTRNPHCRFCPETNPFALTGMYPEIICRACADEQAGKKPTQKHHLSGRHNDPTKKEIPVNDHADLNDRQKDWPERTLRNPDGSPLRAAAGAIRGWLDVLRVIIERTVGWIPLLLERLDEWLCERHGNRWWEQFLAWWRERYGDIQLPGFGPAGVMV